MPVSMDIKANDPRNKQATTNASMIRYRVYSRRVRTMLYLGGVLQDRTHSAIRSYITGSLVILMCLSYCIFLMNLSRDHTDNLILMVKYFGLMCSFIAPALMVSRVYKISYTCIRRSLLQASLYIVMFNGI